MRWSARVMRCSSLAPKSGCFTVTATNATSSWRKRSRTVASPSIGFGPDRQGQGELIEFDSSGAITRTTHLPEKPNDPASLGLRLPPQRPHACQPRSGGVGAGRGTQDHSHLRANRLEPESDSTPGKRQHSRSPTTMTCLNTRPPERSSVRPSSPTIWRLSADDRERLASAARGRRYRNNSSHCRSLFFLRCHDVRVPSHT